MDNRAITEYKLIIKVCNRSECAKYDPFGLCYVDDCLSCPNARVKIIRQDGIIMRNDFENNKNANEESKICAYKMMWSLGAGLGIGGGSGRPRSSRR